MYGYVESLYKNAKHPARTIDYKLLELGMFGSFKSSARFDSDSSCASDNDSFFSSIFSINKMIMATFDIERNNIVDFESYYVTEEIIAFSNSVLTLSPWMMREKSS